MGSQLLGSPEWGHVESFQYQSRCSLCHSLFVHRFDRQFLCGDCVKRSKRR